MMREQLSPSSVKIGINVTQSDIYRRKSVKQFFTEFDHVLRILDDEPFVKCQKIVNELFSFILYFLKTLQYKS